MRVLRIYPTANDPRHRLRDLALQRLGVEVGLVAPDHYGSDWSADPIGAGLPHWRSRLVNRSSIPLHLWDPRALRSAVRSFEPDLVDVHEEPYFPAGAQGALAAGGRPLVMQSCQNIPKRHPAAIRRLRDWVFARVDGMYPCSSRAAEVLRGWGFGGRIDVVPYGVEDELFEVRPTGERIGFVGRLVPEKGLDDALGFGNRLLCVGKGPLAEQARAAGAEVVTARSTDELARQLERMAVVVIPSRTTPTWKEQFGRVAAEAMAAGVPVVAYASGALPEVIGDAGLLVNEGDRVALGRAVEWAQERSRDLAERGRKRAWAEFRWDSVALRMTRLYAGVLREARAVAA
jgi:glycosyltransferase involved in cell wall biosynthesis